MGKALESLKSYLATYHPYYTVADVKPSKVRGYLKCTKPCSCNCPPYDGSIIGFPSGNQEPHYHTISIIGYRRGFGKGIYAFWRAVVKEYQEQEADGPSKGIRLDGGAAITRKVVR